MQRALKNWLLGDQGKRLCILLLCAALLLSAGIGTTFSYLVKETPTLVNLFLNGVSPDGDLIIQKTVEHPFEETYTVPETLAFTFAVNLGEAYAGKTVSTSQGEKTADENGVITVTVAPEGRTAVYHIEEGTAVTVTEINIGKGFAPDAVSREVTMEKYRNPVLVFTNTYAPEKADTSGLSASGEAVLNGRDWQEGDSITFELSVYQDGEWKSLGTQTVTYELVETTVPVDPADPNSPTETVLVPKADFDKFDFTGELQDFDFDHAGTYSFRVTKTGESIEDLLCDPVSSKFDVLVGDEDMDGSLEIQAVTTTSANTAPGHTTATIEIQKVLEDASGQDKTPAGFFFELYDEENNLVEISEATIANGETAIRLVYTTEDAGKTFTYVLKEENGGQTLNAMTYDNKEYKLQVTVTENPDGTLSAYVYDW